MATPDANDRRVKIAERGGHYLPVPLNASVHPVTSLSNVRTDRLLGNYGGVAVALAAQRADYILDMPQRTVMVGPQRALHLERPKQHQRWLNRKKRLSGQRAATRTPITSSEGWAYKGKIPASVGSKRFIARYGVDWRNKYGIGIA